MSEAAAAADLLYRPVTELAELVRSGELSARELVQTSLDRIEELDPKLNAFVDVCAEDALAHADAIGPGDERPFAGVPIAIKNNRAVKGMRLTFAAELLGDFVATYDHNVTRRVRNAGFIVVGTTTLPEYGILPTSEGRYLGPTRNPWDPARTPGGSSGGSAAAVASGMVPIAHGNDGGGSTRIPASCCGLVGLKPQRGRVSQAPILGDTRLNAEGVLTRTVAETALLLDVLAGYEPGDATWAPDPVEPFATSAAREPGRLRIGFSTRPPVADAVLDPSCEAVTRDVATLLESLGHEVEEVDPPWPREGMLEQFTALFTPLVCTAMEMASRRAGRPLESEDMESVSWMLWEGSGSYSALHAALADIGLMGYAREVITWMSPYDALLTPGLAEPPVPIGEIPGDSPDPATTFHRSALFTPYTAGFNITGQPAISLPVAHGDDGLPRAVQVVGQPAQEGALLALAAQLEAAQPWADRRPPV